ncbi:MAG: MBL fold metallo-hydrolase [Hyphomicrobiaceae bacterium]
MVAAMKGPLRSRVHRFQLGEFEVTTILDGALVRDAIKPPFCMDQDEATIASLAADNFVPSQAFEHTFTPTIVNTGSQLVLFDTGNGAGRRDAGLGYLRTLLPEAGYQPEDVDVVAFTHVHPDHIAGLREEDALAFPNARYVIGQVEYDEWHRGDKIPPQRQENRDLFLRLVVPLAENMTFLQPDDDVVAGIKAVESYGHSLGHLSYLVESAGRSCLIWGDVANHYVFSLQRPAWQVAFDDDKEQAIATRNRILEMTATEKLLVVGHHMPFPGIGYVEKLNGVYRWVPASYQMRV